MTCFPRPLFPFNSSIVSVGVVDPFGFFSGALDLKAITRALRHCRRILAIRHGKSLHSLLIKYGVQSDVFVANNLMGMYSDFELYRDAERLFDEMPARNVASWTALISAHTQAGIPSEALNLFTQMLDNGSEEPNRYTFSAALKACAMVGNLEMGKWIHKHILRGQMQCDNALRNAILDMYINCGSMSEARRVFNGFSCVDTTFCNIMIAGYSREGHMDEAEKLFHQCPEPDIVSYNTMVAGFAQTESPKALDYVCLMHRKGFKLDNFTFPCALKTCGSQGFEKMGESTHSYIIKSGFEVNNYTVSSLIDMYANCGNMNSATKIFNGYSSPSVFIHEKLPLLNCMLSGFAVNRCDKQALHLVSKIHSSGIGFDAFTLSSALKVCINLQNMRMGLQAHGLMITKGYHLDHIVGCVLVDLYARCGNLKDALRLFLGFPHKDVIAWTGLINACIQRGSNELAFSTFRDMLSLKIEVDHFVVSSILKACSILSWLQGGEQVHAYSIKRGFASESVMVSSLIDMYSKCGDIEASLKVFETTAEKDTVCWTGMIVGCGYNGKATEAIQLFEEMLGSGNKPNEITFLAVLSACRHAGLVGEACKFFSVMSNQDGLKPRLEHYCCMVDILSRAGKFKEAKQLIFDMPYEPDETMWNSLLGSSVIHQNSDFGKLSSVGHVPFSPINASGYVTLSNVYASLGMWDVSAKFRKVIRRGIIREAGRSWIEVKSLEESGDGGLDTSK